MIKLIFSSLLLCVCLAFFTGIITYGLMLLVDIVEIIIRIIIDYIKSFIYDN